MREEILLRKLFAGDASAMDELVRMYYPEILRYCKWHAPDAHLAEDAAQETFLKAIKYLGGCGFSGKFRNLLYKIAGNTCIDLYRNRQRDYVQLEEMKQELYYAEQGFEEAADKLLLQGLVRKMEPSVQEIVLLRFGQDLKLREIADIMGLPMRTVQSRLRAALKEIRHELMKGGEANGKKNGKQA